jgi:D-alanyl-lipoteichoic acid acyltransferase DltB (MBOAT superfamily)
MIKFALYSHFKKNFRVFSINVVYIGSNSHFMLFSSPVFLFLFLPLVLLGYYFANDRIKNYWLLLSSLVFFAWGGATFTVILILSIILNYWFGLKVFKHQEKKKRLTGGFFPELQLISSYLEFSNMQTSLC